jgi:hypothetical protein
VVASASPRTSSLRRVRFARTRRVPRQGLQFGARTDVRPHLCSHHAHVGLAIQNPARRVLALLIAEALCTSAERVPGSLRSLRRGRQVKGVLPFEPTSGHVLSRGERSADAAALRHAHHVYRRGSSVCGGAQPRLEAVTVRIGGCAAVGAVRRLARANQPFKVDFCEFPGGSGHQPVATRHGRVIR